MSTTDSSPLPSDPSNPKPVNWQLITHRFVIWGMFLGVLYLARDFFFVAFMTFLFSYLTLNVVDALLARLPKKKQNPRIRKLLTGAVFIVVPTIVLGLVAIIGARMLDQAERVAGWLSHFNPENDTPRVLEGVVGPVIFHHEYGGPTDTRYQKGLEAFRKGGEQHVVEYNAFPHLETWVEAGFNKKFNEEESGAIRQKLSQEGTSSKDFEHWFLTDKLPQLQADAQAKTQDSSAPLSPLIHAVASTPPEQLLEQARRNSAVLSTLRKQWTQETVERGLIEAQASSEYKDQFRSYYENHRTTSPTAIPYSFEQYEELKQAYVQGPVAFGKAVEKFTPTADSETEAQVRADFEAQKTHELFQHWWQFSSSAKFIRSQADRGLSGDNVSYVERLVANLLNLPLDLGTALLLSLFICIDFPNMRLAVRKLRDTWLREAYDEIAPVMHDLQELIGRFIHAQGLISLCNAVMLFILLTIIGVEHTLFLCGATFVLCLVPTLGTIIAWVLIAAVALIQPGGGIGLALKASAAVAVVIAIENFVLSPKILGKMMELHPVLIIAILPLAEYFFGIWGLILATPVAVYVIHVVILRQGLPGKAGEEKKPSEAGASSG